MDVCTNYFSNASCQEIPDDNSTIITANCKQRAPPIKCACQGHADTIQGAISFLKMNINTTTHMVKFRHQIIFKGSL